MIENESKMARHVESQKQKLTILAIAPFVWTMGDGKGMPSAYCGLKGYVDAGHEVHLVIGTNNRRFQPKMIYNGIHVHYFYMPFIFFPQHFDISKSPFTMAMSSNKFINYLAMRWFFLVFILKGTVTAFRVARQIQPDLVYGFTPYGAPVSYLIRIIFGRPNINRMFGTFLYDIINKPLLLLARWLDLLVFVIPCSLLVITNDGTQGDLVAKKLKIPMSRLKFWINGINKNIYVPTISVEYFKNKLGINPQAKTVLALSQLISWKRLDRLISLIPNVIDKNKDVIFLIVGDGPERTNLEALAKRLGVTRYVRFVGSVPYEEVKFYFNSADVFVSLNDTSNLSNPVLEAMVCGKPIITLNTGGTGTVIKDGETGFLVDPNNIQLVPSLILKLLEDSNLRDRLGSNARDFALSNLHTWDERMNMEIETVSNLIEQIRRGR